MRAIGSRIILEWGESAATKGVSVAISLYNYAHYIEECLESIASQDFADIQLVVVDDYSQRDNSLGKAQAWMQKHKARFQSGLLIRHEANRGLAEARNTGFKAAACDTVFVMDADNVIFPSCLRKLNRALRATDGDVAYSQLVMFGDVTGVGFADYWSKDLLAKGPYIDAMALVHKRVWKAVGGYTHIEGGWEDYDFWCKIAERDKFHCCYIPELLGKYRVHSSSMLRTDSAKNYDQIFNILSLRHPWIRLK